MSLFMRIQKGTFRYVGGGVLMSDAAVPVCWYKPQTGAAYRVIYGDLHVANVAEADLPKVKPVASAPQDVSDVAPAIRLTVSTAAVPICSFDLGRWDIDGQTAEALVRATHGGPYDWLTVEGPMPPGAFSLHARMPGAGWEAIQAAVTRTIEERLGLSFHHEKRKMSVYLLTAPSGKNAAFKEPANRKGSKSSGQQGADYVVRNLPVSSLAGMLEYNLGRPVRDETGIKGDFDYHTPLPAKGFDEIAKAVHDALGLELVAGERELDVLVVTWNGQPLKADPASPTPAKS
jgi:uncharacterized protein (TIGR03435 family)